MKELNVETIFYKVAQKPGKPIFAGKDGSKWVFALPGNPASALVCFYEYVYPTIRTMQGFEKAFLTSFNLNLLKNIEKKEDLALFIRAKKIGDDIMPLDGQDSNMLRSFAMANAFIYVPSEKQTVKAGELVEVHLLPQ
jgi:molybdopterin molybdotransferase